MPRFYLNFIMLGIKLILSSWTRRKSNQNINISNQFLASQCHNMYKIWHFLANWHLDSGHEKSKMYSLQQNQILLNTSVSCQLCKNKISITFCWAHHQSEGVKIISNTKHMYLRGIKLGSKVVMIRTAMLKSNGALTTGTLVVFCSNADGSLLPTAPVRCSLSLSLVTNAPFSFNARKHELSWTRNLWEGKQFSDYHIIFFVAQNCAHSHV